MRIPTRSGTDGTGRPLTPSPGCRVSLRYRLPPGSVPPLTDVVGVVETVDPLIRLRTKSGDAVTVAPADVVSVRELSRVPVRTSQIRALEHAAALAWPGLEQHWLDGWLLRAGRGFTHRANSAVPLNFSATLDALPGIVDWYAERGLTPWLAVPERLLGVRDEGVKPTRVMVRDLTPAEPGQVRLLDAPDAGWLATYARAVPAAVLTAAVDGTFATVPGVAVGRGAVTGAPDGTRWLGISAVHTAPTHRRRGYARAVCAALMAWGGAAGAQRVYVQVLDESRAAIALYRAMGFGLHHQLRYLDARSLLPPRI